MKKKPLYCGYAWRSIFINEFAKSYPCCYRVEDAADHPGENEISYSNSILAQSVRMEEVRRTLFKGEFPSMCSFCQKSEELFGTSKRLESNEKSYLAWNSSLELGETPGTLGLIDIHLGNLCNLECRMCTPRASRKLGSIFDSVFGDESGHKVVTHWQSDDRFWAELHQLVLSSPKLSRLHFAGGEPLLITPLWNFLSQLNDSIAEKLTLSFNSNLTVIPKKMTEIFSKFKRVKVDVSIDGTAPIHEYIRYPSKLSTIYKHIDLIRTSTKSEVSVSTVIQLLNVFDLPALFNELEARGLNSSVIDVSGRPFLHLRALSPSLRARLRELYEEKKKGLSSSHQMNLSQILQIMDHSEFDPRAWTDFWRITGAWDNLRGMKVGLILPEYFTKNI